jgi:hypothetical protein
MRRTANEVLRLGPVPTKDLLDVSEAAAGARRGFYGDRVD